MNDCEKAFEILKSHADEIGPYSIKIKRIAAPAGTISDGTRAFTVGPCARRRWLVVGMDDLLAEIDQRDHFNDPEGMALAVLEAIETHAAEWRAQQ